MQRLITSVEISSVFCCCFAFLPKSLNLELSFTKASMCVEKIYQGNTKLREREQVFKLILEINKPFMSPQIGAAERN